MKKNFFKKLSFVLALAMIVSVIMPAAGAFAATKAPKLSATKKYLHLDKESYNEYDFNITNKVKGWKYKWSSANENVAEVAKNGLVTATGVGTTKVSVVISDKDGDEVDELKATVVVRDNIASVKITNAPADGKLAVGASNDFNRSFTTVSGSTKKTSSITRWSVDKEGATISDSGLFVATAAGEYTVTARSFQSTAKYESWLVDSTKYASYVLGTDTVKVTVAASMVKAEQVDLDTLKVTFDSAVTDAAAKLGVYSVIGTAEVVQTIKKVTMNTENTVATVDLYVPFAENTTFVVKHSAMTSKAQFVSATTKPEEVASMEIVTKTVELGTAKTIEIALLNKNGVNIANSTLLTRVDLKTSSNSSYVNNKDLTLFKVGDTTTLTATYHTYNYDTTTGTELNTLTASAVVACVDKSKDLAGSLNSYTVLTDPSTPDFTDTKTSIAVGDSAKKLYVQLKGTEADGDVLYTTNAPLAAARTWNFTSSNTDVLIVDAANGLLYPVKVGSAVIVIKLDDVVVGSATVTVTSKREVATVTLSSYNFNLSNDNDTQDVKTVDIKVKDQLGADYDTTKYTATVALTSSNAVDVKTSSSDTAVAFNGSPNGTTATGAAIAAEGTYTYKVTVKDDASNKEIASYITVNVQKPSDDDAIYYYRLETDKSDYDMKIKSDDTSENVKVQLFGYATNGVRNKRLNVLNTPGVTVTVKNASGARQQLDDKVLSTDVATDDAYLKLVTVTGTSIQKADKGTYTVTVVSGSGSTAETLNANYFTVADTQPAPVVTVNKLYTDKTNKLDAAKDCFTVKVDGSDKTLQLQEVVGTSYVGDTTAPKGNTVFVKELYLDTNYTVNGVAGTLRQTVAVNTTITYNYR